MSDLTKTPYRKLLLLAALILICFGALEIWLYTQRPTRTPDTEEIEQSLVQAADLFNETGNTLLSRSRALSKILKEQLTREAGQEELLPTIHRFQDLWGIALFREQTPVIWEGFGRPTTPEPLQTASAEPDLQVTQSNNVVFLECRVSFTILESGELTPYQLITRVRFSQDNALPLAKSSEYHILDRIRSNLDTPVRYAFFDRPTPLPDRYHILSTAGIDSAGITYATPEEFGTTYSEWRTRASFWESTMLLLAFLILIALAYYQQQQFPKWLGLLVQLSILFLAWLTLAVWSIPGNLLPYLLTETTLNQLGNAYGALARFSTHAVFGFLIVYTLTRRVISDVTFPGGVPRINALLYSLLLGITASTGTGFLIDWLYRVSVATPIPIMDLQIIPNTATVILFLTFALLLSGLGLALFSLGILFKRTVGIPGSATGGSAGLGVILGLIPVGIVRPELTAQPWFLLLVLFVILAPATALTLKFYRGTLWNEISVIRGTAILALVLSLMSLPILYKAHIVRLDRNLLRSARDFTQEEDAFARQITGRILRVLEQEFSGTSVSELNRQAPSLRSRFNETINNTITDQWLAYSLDLQFIRPDGSQVASYSTDLNSPNWVRVFNLQRLSTAVEVERITRDANRPIVQMPQLINAEEYETFYRGWIPIFNPQREDPVGWILCSVYKDRPEFNKPIRAVLASLTYDDWKDSYMLMHYRNGNLTRIMKRGVTGRYPKYNQLQREELAAVSNDTLNYYESQADNVPYRHLLYRYSESDIIKASTLTPNLMHVLFNFFRFSLTVLMFGYLLLLLYYLLNVRSVSLWGEYKKFEHRIFDSFLLVTLVFLGFLVVITQYAIKNQNEKMVRQELFEKLEGLTDATESNRRFRESIDQPSNNFSLDSLASPLNADATFYRDLVVTESTTPQIYRQNILPELLPFPVYEDLYLNQKREALSIVELGSQDLLIGYRSILSPENRPVAALAIPTFLRSPKYEQQLLETISYLIVFYLVIFGIFALGTSFISKQLTRPLRYIQKGLNTISEGNLDTSIPVKSNDEIGSLARAYNEMVERLRELQEELAIAEREAAWKEMAQQVAHEIKNPLTPMKLNIQHLERQLQSDEEDPEELKAKIKKITGNLIEQIQSLNNIASDFSKFSQPIQEEFSEFDLNHTLRSIAELFDRQDDVTIQTELEGDELILYGASDELKRVCINLVKNALEAIPDGGSIVIKSYTSNSSAFIEIEDDGIGIPEEDKNRIFVPNFSTKSSGTGLGLAISKKIVEAHEGSISFASIKDKGTTFIIKLPLPTNSR